jgi:uncharacterized protein involved in type VI secretion and phage assembly
MMDHAALLERTVAPLTACYLGEVTSVKDEDSLNRVQVRLFSFDGVDGQDAAIWARVAVPFAGQDRGAFLFPDKGDEVVVSFINGDARMPVVIGSLWNGKAKPKDQFGGSGDKVDRWIFVGKAGTRIAIVEESQPTITLKTPGGAMITITDDSGGKIELTASKNTLTIDSSGITLKTSSTVSVQASTTKVESGQVKVDAGMSTFSGMVKCDVLKATSVIGETYTPGAGNVW